MTGSPALSVIIPTYNRARELPRAIKSVQAQSLRDLEIIVCDDCSTDDTASIVGALAANDPRIRYLRTPANAGPAAARNLGISSSRAEFLSTLDSDDIYLDSYKLEEELRISRHLSGRNRFAIGFSRKLILDESLRVLRIADTARTPIAEGNILNGLLSRSIDIPRDFVFPKALLHEVGCYDPTIPIYEDWDLKIRIASRANFYFTGLDGVGYVQHKKGLSKIDIEDHIKWLWHIFEKNIGLVEPQYVPQVRRDFRRYVSYIHNLNSPNSFRRIAAHTGLLHNPVLRALWSAFRTISPVPKKSTEKTKMNKAPIRRKHVSPVPQSDLPVVSVITVCRNAGANLRQTMETVFAQTYPAIEYIIIDGGSTDGSLTYVDENLDKIAYFISEPDGGIYEAMNKGIKVATGEWIIFMNAGDYFVSPNTISDVMALDLSEADLVYGNSRFIMKDRSLRIPARPLDTMWQRISFSHQSLFARTHLMKQHPFSEKLRVVADYEFYFKMYSTGKRLKYVPLDIAYILPGGFSEKALWRRTIERWSVVRQYRRGIGTDLFYLSFILKEVLRPQLRRKLGHIKHKLAWQR